MRSLLLVSSLLVVFAALPACKERVRKEAPAEKPAPAKTERAVERPAYDRVSRTDFNRVALELALPLFWSADADGDRAVDPAEVAVFWGLVPGASLEDYVAGESFTPAFDEAMRQIARRASEGPAFGELPEAERARRELVLEELAQGRQTLVRTDLRELPEYEQTFVQSIVEAAEILDGLYEKQLGVRALEQRIPEGDTQSRALFFRNHGFRCTAPRTQGNPACSAIPDPPRIRLSGLYPQARLQEEGFCESLAKSDPSLAAPFTVVVEDGDGALVARPYHEVFTREMTEVSGLLKEAAEAFPDGEEEALKAYLLAAAQAFLDDDWVPADEAWAKMNARNSDWYLRIGPDEVYADPCGTKAMFHVSFGRINQGSLKWQALLDPLKGDMERDLARLAGRPYRARKVDFDLPDFMDVVLNAGDSRNPSGATIGQSLPNFGPVANEGRGRTVAMVNLYTDPDSLAALEEAAGALFCADAMAHYTTAQEPGLMSTLLHEAAHNLGPSHQYKVKGKVDRQVFGGPLASMMEELKAQTAALYFTDWLADRKEISREDAQRAYVRALQWGFGHISRGMYDEEKHPRTYSQLAAIQLGSLIKAGGVVWKEEEAAANGKDKGCFSVDFGKLDPAVAALMKDVARIKARGDRRRAERLVSEFVEVDGKAKEIREAITERTLRAPKASFVYALRFDE